MDTLTMRQKRHGLEEIMAKLRRADGMLAGGRSIGEVCARLEISENSYYRWRKLYGNGKGIEPGRVKELELENARLKKLVADLSLENAILKEGRSAKRRAGRARDEPVGNRAVWVG